MRRVLLLVIILAVFVQQPMAKEKAQWWRVFFTSPGLSQKKASVINPQRGIVAVINHAKKSFYGAFYELSSPKITAALIRAKKRGVDVRLVIDSDYYDKKEITQCIEAGIDVVQDNRRAFMHNKFAIVDGYLVWTGSFNLTKNGSLKNNNNSILLASRDLAAIYINEFAEMYKERIFGNRKESGPFAALRGKRSVKISNTLIKVYFSPEDSVEEKIVDEIRKAKKSILFMAFSFTSDAIGEAMIKRAKAGVKVYGIFEKRGSGSKYSEYVKMKLEGIKVRVDRNSHAMHHKVIIIDDSVLITGSYNFSKNANKRNDENILIINNKQLAQAYLREFKKLYR